MLPLVWPCVETFLLNIKGGIQMEQNWPLWTSHQTQCPVWPLTQGTGDSFVLPRRNRWQFGILSRAMINMLCYHSKNIYFSELQNNNQLDICDKQSKICSSQFTELLYLSLHLSLKYVIEWFNTCLRDGDFKSKMLSRFVTCNFKYIGYDLWLFLLEKLSF